MNQYPADAARTQPEGSDAKLPTTESLEKLHYEPPSLVPVGNLFNLLGKSGARADYTYKRPNSGRP
ncbi:MAG: hypothetical protein K2R98_18165 [Gemmataceae bacterium]|nr:hypothetical protein [Gemmataceae bacterium]